MTIEFETTIILLSVLCVLRYNSTFSILLNNCLILNDFLTILFGLVPTLLYWLSFCLRQHLYNAQDVIIQLILRLEQSPLFDCISHQILHFVAHISFIDDSLKIIKNLTAANRALISHQRVQSKYIIYFSLLMESDSESSISYSQQEVIWAKIQGHPWWPAFIDQVHRDNGGKTQYTVNFFGDCTHSRLGASKLNKFQEFYAEHYLKARTHRKLMGSLKLAQQTMKQNEQDIQVFADIRQDLKQKRRWETKTTQIRRDSSSSNESDQIEELPKLQKAMTSLRSRASRSKPCAQKNQDESSKLKQQRLKRNRSLPASKQAHWSLRYPKKFAEDASQVQSFYNNQSIVNQEHDKIYDQLQQQSLSDDFQRNRLKKDKIIKKAHQIPISNGKLRKRGRPRKIKPSEILNDSKENHFSFWPSSKRKIIHKTGTASKFSFKSLDKSLSKEDVQIIQNTRKLMKNREALIDYLTDVTITTSNVQQILELGVVERLREGDDQKQVQDIISMLMNTLMLKYFPNDNKSKGSSFHIQRKKKNAANAEKSLEVHKEKQEQEVKEKNCLSGEECRKKTVLKLQKYLSKNSEPLKDTRIRDISIQIETIFFAEDRFVGQRYKRLALKALSALKEGSMTPFELIRRLKQNKYD